MIDGTFLKVESVLYSFFCDGAGKSEDLWWN